MRWCLMNMREENPPQSLGIYWKVQHDHSRIVTETRRGFSSPISGDCKAPAKDSQSRPSRNLFSNKVPHGEETSGSKIRIEQDRDLRGKGERSMEGVEAKLELSDSRSPNFETHTKTKTELYQIRTAFLSPASL